MIANFDETAIKLEKNIEKSEYANIAMLDGEDNLSHHYHAYYETYDGWMDRMNEGEGCVLCKVELDWSKDGQLTHKMEDYKEIACLALILMRPISSTANFVVQLKYNSIV